ncbi:MAG TPA: Fe-S cluster assembly protein SufD, partial [Terriglobia bacterium]|nr:Fe-S cluster assembly protein SufD [Terriglobia bacterium]
AMDRFGDLGFPTTKNEEWRFTSVSKLAATPFTAPEPTMAKSSDDVARQALGGVFDRAHPWVMPGNFDGQALFFVNGSFVPELSARVGGEYHGRSGSEWQVAFKGVRVESLSEALAGETPQLERHLTRYASYLDHSFVALNTALFEDGAFIEVKPNTRVEKLIVLVFVTSSAAKPQMTHPRNLILVGAGAQASFVELHVGPPGHPYFKNAVTELVAGENAVVDYTRIQDEGTGGYHVGILQLEQARSSSVTTHTISIGSSLDREEARAVLNGEGAEALLHGLYVISGHQHVDNHTLIDHAKPHCSSREVYKGVLDGYAGGVFNGKIAVRQDAQKTDSKQSNKNLLLSENATINTKPQLEIYADDVKCTHGATIGQIDPEAVFYLRSRGIGLEEARNLLIQAFANDILNRIKFEPLRASLQRTLAARLGQPGNALSRDEGAGRVSLLEEVG